MVNKSKTYILPLINEVVRVMYLNHLKNTYIYADDYDKRLFVISYVDEITNEFSFKIMDSNIKKSDIFVDRIDKDDGTINYILEIPDGYVSDYDKFVVGKYSKINNSSKQCILNFMINNLNIRKSMLSTIRDTLYLGEDLRKVLEISLDMIIPKDWELSSIIDSDKETFNLE